MGKLSTRANKVRPHAGLSATSAGIFVALAFVFALLTWPEPVGDKEVLCDATAKSTPIALRQAFLSARDCPSK